MYIGGLAGGNHYSPRVGIIEGGIIYNLIGGPLTVSAQENYNDIIMYIKGGTIDVVTGGAGLTTTYGNRIIQMTGGKINYALFGGSNGVSGSNGDAILRGETYIYVGGNAEVGDQTLVNNNANETTSGVEAGSIFGAGNGNASTSPSSGSSNVAVGSVYKSTIIIDENATIRKNVYGGGNYGAVGTTISNPPANPPEDLANIISQKNNFVKAYGKKCCNYFYDEGGG